MVNNFPMLDLQRNPCSPPTGTSKDLGRTPHAELAMLPNLWKDEGLPVAACAVTPFVHKVGKAGTKGLETSIKEGLLLKQTSSFQRWKKRYFKLRGRTLYYAKDSKSLIFDEVDLSDASVAESSTKNVNNSFTADPPAHTFFENYANYLPLFVGDFQAP
uniref:Uncharacterized protein n=1 Tax=Sphaerodactylus townsendi TaxID=933632 RepID=A0ACB8FJD2_9SAUR